jgi:hypothetical protein
MTYQLLEHSLQERVQDLVGVWECPLNHPRLLLDSYLDFIDHCL